MKYKVSSKDDRGGKSLECYSEEGYLVIEIFYTNKTKKFTIETIKGPINASEVNRAMLIAEKRLPLSENHKNTSITKIIQALEIAARNINKDTENTQARDYLLAMASWLEDCDGYYKNNNTNRRYICSKVSAVRPSTLTCQLPIPAI